MRVEMEPGWEDRIAEASDELLRKLGTRLEADAKRYAPVRSGKLRDSIHHDVEAHRLIVEADAPYAAYVELGHKIAHGPGMKEVGPARVHQEPFLRPALYQERSG